jgi:hypothetical protein
MPLNAAGTLRNRDSHTEKKIGQCDRLIIRTVQETKICVVSSELCVSKHAIQFVLTLQALHSNNYKLNFINMHIHTAQHEQ